MEENQVHIPDGWKLNDLGNLIKEQKKSSLKVSDAANFGEFPFFTSGEAILKHTSKQLDGKNIFLATGGVANIKYYEGDAAYSTDTYAVTTKDEIDTEYLYFDLLNILYYINANYFQGSGLKHLQKKDLKKHQILFPENPTEQTTIASILSKVDEAIAQTEQLIAKYTRTKTGLMQDLLTKGIDEHGNIRSEQTHEFKDSPLGRIPKEWEVSPLNQLCDLIVDCKNRTCPFVDKSEYPVIRTSNIKEGKLVWEDMKYTDSKSYKIWTERAIPQKDDVIITREAPLGQVLKIPRGITPVLGQRTMLFRLDKSKLLPDFLVNLILTEKMQLYLHSLSGGSTVHHLKVGDVKTILIQHPKSPNEQQKIQDLLVNEDRLIASLSKNLSKLQSLKTGLMQDLLSGKVRVKHLIKETASV
jgi:type I restriction enzyme S subunit